MRITKNQLKHIIQEELTAVMREANLDVDPDTEGTQDPSRLIAARAAREQAASLEQALEDKDAVVPRSELGYPSPESLEYKAAKAGNIVGGIAEIPGELVGTFRKALDTRIGKPATTEVDPSLGDANYVPPAMSWKEMNADPENPHS